MAGNDDHRQALGSLNLFNTMEGGDLFPSGHLLALTLKMGSREIAEGIVVLSFCIFKKEILET